MRSVSFFQQKLHSIGLKAQYLPELLSEKQLNLKDNEGNTLALYESDYKKLKKYLAQQELKIENLTALQLHDAIGSSEVKVIKYFSSKNLEKCELENNTADFSLIGDITTTGGITLKKGGHQNCVVMINDKNGIMHIYSHPKIRSESKSCVVGVSHSSLSKGKKVKFAGSFVHDAVRGWVIENTTGHYGTRAYQMTLFLETLKKHNYDLSQLIVKLWIPHDPKNPSAEEKDYVVKYENAESFLNRVQKSKIEICASLDGLSVSNEGMADSAFGRGSHTVLRLV